MKSKKICLREAITQVFRQENIKHVDQAKFFDYLVSTREDDDALKEFIPFRHKTGYQIDPTNLEVLNIYLRSFLTDSLSPIADDTESDLEESVEPEKPAADKPLGPEFYKETEGLLYKLHLARMNQTRDGETLPVNIALNLFIGPPGEFERYDRNEELEGILLSSPQTWQELGVNYGRSLTASRIEKGKLPGFYKELAAKVEWAPSAEAEETIKLLKVSDH